MRIVEVIAEADFTLRVTPDNGRVGTVDVRPFLRFEAFEPLKDPEEFVRVLYEK